MSVMTAAGVYGLPPVRDAWIERIMESFAPEPEAVSRSHKHVSARLIVPRKRAVIEAVEFPARK